VSPAVATIILRITLLNYDAKHLAKASSRYKAQPGARLSAVTLRSVGSTCPSFTPQFHRGRSRIRSTSWGPYASAASKKVTPRSKG